MLDASALLAFFCDETGADVVEKALAEGACKISAINWAEVLCKLVDTGVAPRKAALLLAETGVVVLPVDEALALEIAILRGKIPKSISLGDRACLALGLQLKEKILTADKEWLKLPHLVKGLQLELIR